MSSEYTREEAEQLVESRSWWYHTFEIYPGVVTPGVYDPSGTFSILGFPDDLTGKTILELGPADGYFSKRLSTMGADVTACDYMPKDFFGFDVMEKLHGRPMRFMQSNIYGLPDLSLGKFDWVLCMGLLYHMPDMVKALHNLRAVCAGTLIVETLVSTDLGDEPLARYHPGDSLNNDPTNFWSPNVACVKALLVDCGYVVEKTLMVSQTGGSGRAAFWCTVKETTQTIKSDLAYT